jgi:predicted RNA polymerase sigma factor
MSEHFYGRNDTVDISNGGTASLLCGLIATGEQMPLTPALSAVIAYSMARGDLRFELGNFKGAAAAYRAAIVLERDREARQMLEEAVAEMESRWRMA